VESCACPVAWQSRAYANEIELCIGWPPRAPGKKKQLSPFRHTALGRETENCAEDRQGKWETEGCRGEAAEQGGNMFAAAYAHVLRRLALEARGMRVCWRSMHLTAAMDSERFRVWLIREGRSFNHFLLITPLALSYTVQVAEVSSYMSHQRVDSTLIRMRSTLSKKKRELAGLICTIPLQCNCLYPAFNCRLQGYSTF
jgi:hypothetical protein